MPWKLISPDPPSCTTFGVSSTKLLQLRVTTGRFPIKFWSSVCETSVFCVSRIGDSLVTVTSVAVVPTVSVAFTVSVSPTVSTRFFRSTLPKPFPPRTTS